MSKTSLFEVDLGYSGLLVVDRPVYKSPVSLVITGASRSRLQGRPGCDFRKFRKIDFPDFFVKKYGKIQKIRFLDSWDQNKILKFLDFYKIFIYGQYFLYKASFPSSQASKTLKNKTARSKSTGVPTFSPFGPPETSFSPVLWPKMPFFDLKLI